METKRYKVVLLGISSDIDPHAAREQLARTFRVAPDKIEELLAAVPVTVKSHIDYQTALKCLGVIQHAGGICRTEPVEAEKPVLKGGRVHGPTIKVCPKCGYCATNAEDLLLTAHDGLGECPACGIIVAKYNSNRDAMHAEGVFGQDRGGEPMKGSVGIWAAVLSHPWLSLLIVAAVIVLGKNFFFNSPGAAPVGDDSAKMVAAIGDDKRPTPKNTPVKNAVLNKILPGETRELVLITYLDYLHRDTFMPISFTPRNSIENNWGDKGLRIEVRNARITPITVALWERLRAKDDLWVPVGYRNITSHGSSNRSIVKGKNLLATPFSAALAKKPDEISMKVDPADPNFRKAPYTLYRLEYELSVSVPLGGEFDARELTHTTSDGKTVSRKVEHGTIRIATFVEFDLDNAVKELMGSLAGPGSWQATKGAIVGGSKVSLDLEHVAGTEGVFISPREKHCQSAGYCELTML